MRVDVVKVTLDKSHYDQAVAVVQAKKINCTKNQARCRLKDTKDKDELNNILGTLAEIAAHIWSKEPWHQCEWTKEQIKNPSLRPHKGLDVGWWDVKATALLPGNLLVRDYHDPIIPYVAVSVRIPTTHCIDCILTGWAYGWEAMQPKYERDPHGFGKCWIMPSDDLRSMATLLTSPHTSESPNDDRNTSETHGRIPRANIWRKDTRTR